MNSELGKQEQGKRGFLEEVISKLSSEENINLIGVGGRDNVGDSNWVTQNLHRIKVGYC